MSDVLTRKEIEAIRKRADRATPEPWCFIDVGERDKRFCETITQVEPATKLRPRRLGQTILRHEAQWRIKGQNQQFIVHARTDIPRLLASLEAAEAQVTALEEALPDAGKLEWLADWLDAYDALNPHRHVSTDEHPDEVQRNLRRWASQAREALKESDG